VGKHVKQLYLVTHLNYYKPQGIFYTLDFVQKSVKLNIIVPTNLVKMLLKLTVLSEQFVLAFQF